MFDLISGACPSGCQFVKNILVYRDRLGAKSEWAFMRRQYLGFRTLEPNWVGCRIDPGLAGSGLSPPLLLGGSGILGPVQRALFKQVGRVPDTGRLQALAPVVVHAQFGRGGALALPLAKHLQIPLVVTFHGGDAFKEKHYGKVLLPSIFQRRWAELQQYASLFVCVSEGVRAKLLERGVPPEKLEVINIGVELQDRPRVARQRTNFLFAGRFVEKKGIFVLIDAIRRFRDAGLETPFTVAGDGPLLEAARARASDLRGVAFPGWLSPERLREEMESAIAMLVPSIVGEGGDAEGLPSVAVEAMSLAAPVVASDSCGLSDLLPGAGAGVIVPSGDAEALCNALVDLSKHPEHALQMGAAAAGLAQQRLSAVVQSRTLEDRLLKIADTAGRGVR